MDNVRAFDIPVDDMQRAMRFYERIFSWDIHPIPGSGGDFHAAHTVPVDDSDEPQIRGAINGGLFKRARAGAKTLERRNLSEKDTVLFVCFQGYFFSL